MAMTTQGVVKRWNFWSHKAPAALKDGERHEGRDRYRLPASTVAGFRAPTMPESDLAAARANPTLRFLIGYDFGASGNPET